MSNDITIGRAYFKENEGLHLNEYCSKIDESALKEDKKNGFVTASFKALLRLKEHFNTHVPSVHSVFNNLFALNSSENLPLQNHFLKSRIA
ncbi:hypothetical protein CRV08_15610 [Halarcobacter ebronensis]|uniref:Uncharacterized protein n=1 Tax=Halarcobacter ebronensis TaxID=1462615 RepID=A0A4Q0Y534_9BACT|nr:hypothetical protein [Halarcobacter ebronensis]RXJ65256.1 hypothetical protein CRV08_15610 [Halarcobacter ebronensis]